MRLKILVSCLILLMCCNGISQEVIIARRRAPASSCSKNVTAPNKGTSNHNVATHNEFTMTVANNGDLVVLSVWCASACVVVSVQDDLLHSFTASTSSPGTSNGGSGTPYIYYLLNATSGSRTFTVTTISAQESQLGGVDFALGTGCAATFDVDAAGTGTGSTINTPSITPAGAGRVLYSFSAISSSITSGNSPWTQGTVYSGTSNADEYILSSASGATAVNYTSSGSWSALAASFNVN